MEGSRKWPHEVRFPKPNSEPHLWLLLSLIRVCSRNIDTQNWLFVEDVSFIFHVDYLNWYRKFLSLLDMIPDLFSETRETDVILGPVVQAGMEALKVMFKLINQSMVPVLLHIIDFSWIVLWGWTHRIWVTGSFPRSFGRSIRLANSNGYLAWSRG